MAHVRKQVDELVTVSVRAAAPESVAGLALEVTPKATAPGISECRSAAWSCAKLVLALLYKIFKLECL